ncbi:unnamed protein product [Moneuplotes crassus]|uniref:Uncharacterized protein n=1 Tax=Euplotes crassus TaxID=5936 RepID=A0AAD2D3X8_EUPCR|nr:unnamed protein product [Moneuplotes crassus]
MQSLNCIIFNFQNSEPKIGPYCSHIIICKIILCKPVELSVLAYCCGTNQDQLEQVMILFIPIQGVFPSTNILKSLNNG